MVRALGHSHAAAPEPCFTFIQIWIRIALPEVSVRLAQHIVDKIAEIRIALLEGVVEIQRFLLHAAMSSHRQ